MGFLLLAAVFMASEPSRAVSIEELAKVLAQGEAFRLVAVKDAIKTGNRVRLKELEKLKGRYFPPFYNQSVGSVGLVQSLRVQQVIDARNMLARWADQTVWVRGISTEDVTDDMRLKLSMPMIVSGTKQYTSVMGAGKTVLLLEPLEFTPADLHDAWEIASKARKATKKSSRR